MLRSYDDLLSCPREIRRAHVNGPCEMPAGKSESIAETRFLALVILELVNFSSNTLDSESNARERR